MSKQILLQNLTLDELVTEVSNQVSKNILDLLKNNQQDKLLTQTEACIFLGVAKSTIIRWEKQGYIKSVRKGHKVLYRVSDLMQGGQDD